MNKSSWPTWKRLSKSDKKWLIALTNLMLKGKQKRKRLFKGLLTGSSKWRQMIWEEKKLISWQLVPNLRGRNNLWIRDRKWRKILLKNKSMPSFGCLTQRKNSLEKKEKLLKREKRYRKPSTFSLGKTIPNKFRASKIFLKNKSSRNA